MDLFYHPRSVAIFGVSDKPMNFANGVLFNLQNFNWPGRVYAIGRRKIEGLGVPVFTDVRDIKEPIDLAVILVPAPAVPDVMRACGEHGIRAAIIEAGGFDEFDDGGRELAEEVQAIAAEYGIRFIGPNCIGTMNAHERMVLHFGPQKQILGPGPVGLIAQSGGIAMWLAHLAYRNSAGFSLASAVGNKLNVDETDLLEQYLKEPTVKQVLLYLESIARGPAFCEVARTADKPIVLYKANRSAASAAIASSHTAALSNDDAVVDAAMRQCAVWRARDANQTVNALGGLAMAPVRGNRLLIVSRSGGHAVMLADAAARQGFELVEPSADFYREIDRLIPVTRITRQNPLDVGDVFDLSVYPAIVDAALREEGVDVVIFFHTIGSAIFDEQGAGSMRPFVERARGCDKPLAIGMLAQGIDLAPLRNELDYPIFETPDDMVEALAINREHQRRLADRDREREYLRFEVDRDRVHSILATPDASILPAHRAHDLLAAWGIPQPPYRLAADEADAAGTLGELGGPVALKLISAHALHKTDLGAVALNLTDGSAVHREAETMRQRLMARHPEARVDGYLLQRMASEGVEMIVGGRRDASFGPVVLVGIGGVLVEVLRSTAIRLAPIDRRDARNMIEELQGVELLQGVRGAPPADIDALADIVERVSALLYDYPEIAEIDLNPVRVYAEGAQALDARLILTQPANTEE